MVNSPLQENKRTVCTIELECTCGFSSRSDKCCTKTVLLKTIPRLINQDSVFVELSDSTTSSGSSRRLFYGSRDCLLCPARQRSEITSTPPPPWPRCGLDLLVLILVGQLIRNLRFLGLFLEVSMAVLLNINAKYTYILLI